MKQRNYILYVSMDKLNQYSAQAYADEIKAELQKNLLEKYDKLSTIFVGSGHTRVELVSELS